MRIGILTHNFPRTSKDRGDAGIFIYDFANELAKKNQVFILCPDSLGKKEKYENLPVTWFKWSGGGQKLGSLKIYDPKSIYNFLNLIINGSKTSIEFARKNELDFCLAAWALPSGIYANYIKYKLKIPYATWSLGSDINQYAKVPILNWLIKKALISAEIRFANSYLLCKKIKELTGLPGIFLPAITKFGPSRTKVVLPRKTFNFLYVGRLEKVKGIDVLIEACGQINKNYQLTIIGPGSLEIILKNRVSELNLNEKVTFVGQKGGAEIAGYMAAADCLVVPSRSESLPLVIIEAARVGLPIIASNVGDCKRIINYYNIGKVVKKEDPKGLSKTMEQVILKGHKFKKPYQKNLDKLSDDFNLKQSTELFLEIIKNK